MRGRGSWWEESFLSRPGTQAPVPRSATDEPLVPHPGDEDRAMAAQTPTCAPVSVAMSRMMSAPRSLQA